MNPDLHSPAVVVGGGITYLLKRHVRASENGKYERAAIEGAAVLEFWIEVRDDGDTFIVVVHELIVHDLVSDQGFVCDVRFTTARHESSEAVFESAEKELRGFLAQMGRGNQERVITQEPRKS